MQVIERVAGHYEVEDVQFGAVYKWIPTSVRLRCICGEKITLSSITTTCDECGADHTSRLDELLATQRGQRDESIPTPGVTGASPKAAEYRFKNEGGIKRGCSVYRRPR